MVQGRSKSASPFVSFHFVLERYSETRYPLFDLAYFKTLKLFVIIEYLLDGSVIFLKFEYN